MRNLLIIQASFFMLIFGIAYHGPTWSKPVSQKQIAAQIQENLVNFTTGLRNIDVGNKRGRIGPYSYVDKRGRGVIWAELLKIADPAKAGVSNSAGSALANAIARISDKIKTDKGEGFTSESLHEGNIHLQEVLDGLRSMVAAAQARKLADGEAFLKERASVLEEIKKIKGEKIALGKSDEKPNVKEAAALLMDDRLYDQQKRLKAIEETLGEKEVTAPSAGVFLEIINGLDLKKKMRALVGEYIDESDWKNARGRIVLPPPPTVSDVGTDFAKIQKTYYDPAKRGAKETFNAVADLIRSMLVVFYYLGGGLSQ